jgi:very-short-patch-repair endonuclease
VKKDKTLFTTFFPILLTTPDVASTLFQGDIKYFDIVLFDEASQLRVEDNLPAILKGKQVIVAGDEHQMPPSNYFQKVLEGTIEEENEKAELTEEIIINTDNLLLDCESLLDFATELGFEKQYLDFHYRSKHPYLIDFSNHAFYGKRLIPLPNNFDYTPIQFYQVDGQFIHRENEAEAEKVITILKEEIMPYQDGTYPTVGIATFNISQRNLIIRKIFEHQTNSENPEFQAKLSALEKTGLFVKNLENIQGDERDIIILSTTYGKKEDGKFYHHYGPINYQKGYKLLNVIITRAKYKIYVCNSIPTEVFLDYNTHLKATKANNRKAIFFAYLTYSKAVSEKDETARKKVLTALEQNLFTENERSYFFNSEEESSFEMEVFQVLAKHFDTAHLLPQFQFAGFKIDLVYIAKNGLKIAIECDGAKAHTSEEAYLHDKHRQEILENHGFIFHRIWSTNWWQNHEN